MIGAASVALGWILAANDAGYPFGIEPMFPAMGISVAAWVVDRTTRRGSER
jgi:hypothetical protein